MAVKGININGKVYPLAPLHPELHHHPSVALPLTITPPVAKSWLNYNYRNRVQRARGLGNYSADMMAGNFSLNGDTIRFSRPLGYNEDEDVPEGKPLLLDGQHRLEACVQSNESFVTYVVYGLEPEVRRTIDTGISRRFQDHLAMQGVRNANVLSAITMRTYAWTLGDRHLGLKSEGITTPALEQFLAENQNLHRSAEIASHVYEEFTGSRIRRGVVGVAHWLFTQADPDQAPWFFTRLGDGAEMVKFHPVMHLRNRIMQDRTEQDTRGRRAARVPDWQILCYMIRAWNALMDDKVVENLPLIGRSDGDVMPTIKTRSEVTEEVRMRLVRLEQPPKKQIKRAS